MRSVFQITRGELHKELWSSPISKLKDKLGVSAPEIVKACEKHNIPRPDSGHWVRVRMGMAPEPDELPPAENPAFEQILLERKPQSEDAVEKYPRIVVSERLSSPHPAVRKAAEILRRASADSKGLVETYDMEAARIAVSPGNVARALRIMDTFYKAIEKEGLRITGRERWGKPDVVVRVNAEEYPVRLREHLKRSDRPLTAADNERLKRVGYLFDRYTYALDGQLTLTIGDDFSNPIIVKDTARTRLEDKIGVAVGRLRERIAIDEEKARRRAIEEAERRRVVEEQRRREEEAERIRKLEQERVNRLQNELGNWRLARDIREYVGTIHAALRKHDAQPLPGKPLDLWLTWLEAHAKRVDPLASLYSELEEFSAKMATQQSASQPEEILSDTRGHA